MQPNAPPSEQQKLVYPKDIKEKIVPIYSYEPMHEPTRSYEISARQSASQNLKFFQPPDNSQLEPYITVLMKLMTRYESMRNQIHQLRDLIDGILKPAPMFSALPIQLLNQDLKHVEGLAEKYKVLYAKGRRKTTEADKFIEVSSCMENCLNIIEKETERYNAKMKQRNLNKAVLKSLVQSFHIISQGTLNLCKMRPSNLQNKGGDPTKFYVSLYVQSLLSIGPQKMLDFPGTLLYCPILQDQLSKNYYIDPTYLQQLSRMYPNWQTLTLCIDILKFNQDQQEVIYTSSSKRPYFNLHEVVFSMIRIRDKVYQFIIFAYLKYIFDCKSDIITIPFRKTYRLRIQLLDPEDQHYQASRQITELITVLFALLRDDKLHYKYTKEKMKSWIKTSLEETFLSRELASKGKAESGSKGFPIIEGKWNKNKSTKQVYKMLENTN